MFAFHGIPRRRPLQERYTSGTSVNEFSRSSHGTRSQTSFTSKIFPGVATGDFEGDPPEGIAERSSGLSVGVSVRTAVRIILDLIRLRELRRKSVGTGVFAVVAPMPTMWERRIARFDCKREKNAR